MSNKYESSFAISLVGDETGETFAGKFTVKTRLSHAEKVNQDVIRRNMLGAQPNGATAGELASNTCEILAQLAVRVVTSPSWWTGSNNGQDLYDSNVLVEVFTNAIKAETDAKVELKKAADEAKKELVKEGSAE